MRAGRWRTAALAFSVALLTLTGCSTSNTGAAAKLSTMTYAPDKRPTAPAVTGTLLDGGTFTLAGERGHVVVMNFWGSWCAPCRVEAADLESVAQTGTAVFVGVNVEDDHDAATAFVTAHSLTYPSIFDPAGHVLLAFRNLPALSPPYTFVFDPRGRLAAVHTGPVTAAQLTSMIAGAAR
jgi:peroxiredoxin